MTPNSVNKKINGARQKLGIAHRRDAARLFLEWEAEFPGSQEGGHSIAPQPITLHQSMILTPNPAVDQAEQEPVLIAQTFDEGESTDALSVSTSERFWQPPLRSNGRLSNDLSTATILSAITKLMLAALFAVGSALSLLSSLSQLARP